LPIAQNALNPRGHAFEARVYAEDPRRGFLPSGGVLRELEWPPKAVFAPIAPTPLRIDAGVEPGDRVVTDYDALLAKVIVHAGDREEALRALTDALASFRIDGATTNLAALLALAKDADVRAGRVFTRLIDERGDALLPNMASQRERAATLASLTLLELQKARARTSPWNLQDGWTVQGSGVVHFRLQEVDGTSVSIQARANAEEWSLVTGTGRRHAVGKVVLSQAPAPIAAAGEVARVHTMPSAPLAGVAEIDARRVVWTARVETDRVAVWLEGEWHRFGLVSQAALAGAAAGKDALQAPMPGVVLAVRAADGDQVRRGQILIVLEAMKMEHSLAAGDDGHVTGLRVKAGDRVREGDLLLKISPPES
jgi:acetyl/propionyl-CoA carboxylase alpha subunit